MDYGDLHVNFSADCFLTTKTFQVAVIELELTDI